MTTVTIQRGSDLRLTGSLVNADGTPIDLTGYTVVLFEATAELGAAVTVTDAAAGAVSIVAEWRDSWKSGRGMSFRVRITSPSGVDTAFPKLSVNVQ